MVRIRETDIALLAGRGALRRTGSLVWTPGVPAIGEEGKEVFTRSDVAGTGYFRDSAGILRRAGANKPRIDWGTDGIDRVLLELSRTNSAINSEALDVGDNRSNLDAVADNAKAPDGAVAMEKFTVTASAANTSVYWGEVTVGASEKYTISFFFRKDATVTWIAVGDRGGTVWHRVWFNLATGAKGTEANASGRIEDLGDFWRISVTANANLSAHTCQPWIGVCNSDGDTGLTGVAGQYFHAWGKQLEIGGAEFASSHITTGAAAVTRPAETLYFDLPPAIATPTAIAIYMRLRTPYAADGGIAAPQYGFIGAGTSSNMSRLQIDHASGVRMVLHNGATLTNTIATVASAHAAGDTLEILAVLNADASGTIARAINGGSVSSTALSALAAGLPASWSDSKFYMNSAGTGLRGAQGFRDLAIVKIRDHAGTAAEWMDAFRNLPLLAA